MVRAEAPGFEPSDFDLQIRGNELVCQCDNQERGRRKDKGYREWRRQEFQRAVTLPSAVDADKVEATYRNGILTLTLPKTEKTKGRRIEVNPRPLLVVEHASSCLPWWKTKMLAPPVRFLSDGRSFARASGFYAMTVLRSRFSFRLCAANTSLKRHRRTNRTLCATNTSLKRERRTNRTRVHDVS